MQNKIIETVEDIAYKWFVAEMSDSYAVTRSEQQQIVNEYRDFLNENDLTMVNGNVLYRDNLKPVLDPDLLIDDIINNRNNRKKRN